ncbi:hypothetical protein H9N28_04930 [Rhodobacter capsulatus]|uniref:hypothetical protein n=1 Tax=Rhodobacter capsulatus TaxID=1061 RepID=UPI0006DC75F1|nr:hypothetical protein [Rhodobacter capsulatus]KQB14413.1 hypothetical protein AP071_15305 [Rhodobacter capsulatus]KQB15067.1 hypothetical protein AP073_14940 [Rhodobacter capsulatus]PZX26277.1 hypothetical protein LY44_00971 [Rhodobacter capsulatus]QNR64182.1 hypothetical protein H9N28_04930 [Rhodobacter capsulatus]
MDHTDSFIDEVTEEVRRDRLFAAFRKYGWIGVVAILGLVGGSAYVEWEKTQRQARAEAFGDGILSALETENPAEALAALPVSGPQGGMLKLLTAAQAAEDGKAEVALADLRAVAGDATLPDSLRQLARLKAVLVAGAAMGAEERAAELAALSAPGAPFRLMAMEQQALAALEAGDRDGAIAKAREIMAEDGVTSGLQQRATELIVALGGDPAAK